jgi:polyhydroxyalkanoate synthase subunit PhaC
MTQSPATAVDAAALTANLLREFERLGPSSEVAARLAAARINVEVGVSPKQEIWALNKTKLYHYWPNLPPEQRKPVPILLVFALINRPYIFDLRPKNSFVQFLLNHGYEVYLLDWGSPGPEDAHYDFSDYALNYLPRAIRALQRHSRSREFSMLGWCIGATISAIYAAMRPNDGLRNLILLTAPIDFSDREGGTFNRWLNTEYYNVDELVRQFGNVPSSVIEYGNKLLKPVENYIGTYLKLWDNLDNPAVVESWLAMNTWVSDNVDFPGGAFRQWVVDFFRGNKLITGKLIMEGRPVLLSNISASLLNVIADKDHIVPNCQSRPLMDAVGTRDKLLLEQRGGHIGIMVGSQAAKKLWPQIDQWLAPRSSVTA